MARALIAAAALALAGTASADSHPSRAGFAPHVAVAQEIKVAAILRQLQNGAPTGPIQLDNLTVVDPVSGKRSPDSSLIVLGSRIRWVGPSLKAPSVPGVTHIDGNHRFAAPGLTDMHIHSSRTDGWLLNLAAGVTTVRDMDGFPWILRARDHISSGQMLSPTMYVAGTIIASEPMDGYAVVAAGPADARAIVRKQAACGYDFIKVHNNLWQPVFDAIAEQARTLGMDLVGHVPHDITLDHALHAGGMRTTEHLKGFLLDRSLTPSDEDYAKALAGTTTWITPTLFTRRGYDRGEWARAIMTSGIARYVPPQVRGRWSSLLARPDGEALVTGTKFVATQNTVMQRLVPLHPHWLTGTDAAGYPFNIMGYALLDELALLQKAGLSPAEAYRASTVEAADAMHESGEFGVLAKGMRADLVLLDSDPMVDGVAFGTNRGVMAHGIWLSREHLDRALSQLAKIYAGPAPDQGRLAKSLAARLVRGLERAGNQGQVFDDGLLEQFEDELREIGEAQLSARVHGLRVGPQSGPCAVPNPVR